MGCGSSQLVPCPGSNCAKDGKTITVTSPPTTPTPSCICCKTQKCQIRKTRQHTPRTNRSAELRKKAIEAKLNKNVKSKVHPRTSKPKNSQKPSTPTTSLKLARKNENAPTPSPQEKYLITSTLLGQDVTSTQQGSVMEPVTASHAVTLTKEIPSCESVPVERAEGLTQKIPCSKCVAVEPAVALTQEIPSCESVAVEPTAVLTQVEFSCESVAMEPTVVLTQVESSCESVAVEPAVVLIQVESSCENVAVEPAVALTQKNPSSESVAVEPAVTLAKVESSCESVAMEPAVALTQVESSCESVAMAPAVALTRVESSCERVAMEPAVALTQVKSSCESVAMEPAVALTRVESSCESVAMEPAVALTRVESSCERVAMEPAVALTQVESSCESVGMEPAFTLTPVEYSCERVAMEPAVTQGLSTMTLVPAEPAVALTHERSTMSLVSAALESVSYQEVYILEPIQTTQLIPEGIDRHSQDISVMDPVPVGNTTPLSQEASGVDIVSAGSVPTDEECSLSEGELDSFVAGILHTQLDLVQKLPSPPTTPKPLLRRTPRVRSPTSKKSSDQIASCVQTVATEKDSAQLLKSPSSFTEGSSADLEIVGSKCRLISTPSSPEKAKKSKYVRDKSEKTPLESRPSNSANTNRTVEQVSQKSQQSFREQISTNKLRKESVESFRIDDGSPQVEKTSSMNKQPKRPQCGKSDTTVPSDSAQTKTGIKMEQGSSRTRTSPDSRKSRRSPEPSQVDTECNNQFKKGSSKFLDAKQAKSKTSFDRKISSRHDSNTNSSRSSSSVDVGKRAYTEPSSDIKKSSAYSELSQARTTKSMFDSSIVRKNKESTFVDAQRYSRRDKHANTKHSSTSTDSKKTSCHAESSRGKAKEGMPNSPIAGRNARKDSSVEAHSRRDKHASTQHSSTSSDSKKSSGYLEPSRTNAKVESKGSRKANAKKKKDVNPIHSNSDNTALATKERLHSLQNSKQTGPCDSPVVGKSHKQGPSTESSSKRKKKVVDKRPQSDASTLSENKVRSPNETQVVEPSSKSSGDCVCSKDPNEGFSDTKSFSSSPKAKRERSGSRKSPSASTEKMNERSQSSRSSKACSTQLEATRILQRVRWISSRRSISSMERTDKKALSVRSPRASPTQFDVLDSSKTLTFASPACPEVRARTSRMRSKTSVNKLEVLNTNDEQQKATSSKPTSGKLQKAGPTKKHSSDAGAAKSH